MTIDDARTELEKARAILCTVADDGSLMADSPYQGHMALIRAAINNIDGAGQVLREPHASTLFQAVRALMLAGWTVEPPKADVVKERDW